MVKNFQKALARKKHRTPKGEKLYFKREKPGKHKCSLCEKAMHGMPHGKSNAEVSKLSKTKRRPDVLFAGELCNNCRDHVVDETIKVKTGMKKMEEVDLVYHNLVNKAIGKIE